MTVPFPKRMCGKRDRRTLRQSRGAGEFTVVKSCKMQRAGSFHPDSVRHTKV
jgi:hypothetical protein